MGWVVAKGTLRPDNFLANYLVSQGKLCSDILFQIIWMRKPVAKRGGLASQFFGSDLPLCCKDEHFTNDPDDK